MTKEQEEAIEMFKELEMCDDKEFVNARETILSMLEEKDKVIDLILDKFIDGTGYYFSEFDYMNKEEIKQYFENKVRQGSDKGATGK